MRKLLLMRKAKEPIKTSKRMFLINMDLRLRSYMYQIKRTFVLEFGENAATLDRHIHGLSV